MSEEKNRRRSKSVILLWHNMDIPYVRAGNPLHTGRASPDAFWVTDNTHCGSLEIGYLSVFVCLCLSVFGCQLCGSLSQFVLFLSGMKAHETTQPNHIPSSRTHEMYHFHLFHLRTTALGSLNCDLPQAILKAVLNRAPQK